MSTIVLRSVKGTPLTNQEVDDNFSNLNTDKLELGGTYSAGTANAVLFLSGSKVLTSGSALTFDGTNFGVLGGAVQSTDSAGNARSKFEVFTNGQASNQVTLGQGFASPTDNVAYLYNRANAAFVFGVNNTEQMRLTSTGLGIGTSSPASKLTVASTGPTIELKQNATGAATYYVMDNTVETGGKRWRFGFTGAAGIPLFSLYNQTDNVLAWAADASGNLGLGVTPSAWSSYTAMQFPYGGSIAGYNGSAAPILSLSSNAYFVSGVGDKYVINGPASRYLLNQGVHQWYTAPSGTAGNAISFTQAMTLDASGNLGIGTTSPSSYSAKFVNYASTGSSWNVVASGANQLYMGYDSSIGANAIESNGALIFATKAAFAESARIDSSGNLLVACTSFPSATVRGALIGPNGPNGVQLVLSNTITSTFQGLASFRNGNGEVGRIDTSGTSTSYVTSSDYRLKNTIAPMTGALAKVALLKPCTYKWKSDGSDGEGFIAHELAEVVPQCVTGEKDAIDAEGNPQYQGIDTSFLVATLTAAIQEQQALIASLTARLDAANL